MVFKSNITNVYIAANLIIKFNFEKCRQVFYVALKARLGPWALQGNSAN